MIISDLSALETVEGSAVVGGTLPTFYFKKDVNAKVNTLSTLTLKNTIDTTFNKLSTIKSLVDAKGNAGTISGDNEVQGKDTDAEIVFNQLTVQGVGTTQSINAIAAAK